MMGDRSDRERAGMVSGQGITTRGNAMSDKPNVRRRRGRPWYRPRNVILAILLVIVLVVLWAVWETWNVYRDEPGTTVDYHMELTRLCESRQPAGEDGWPQLAAVLERLEAASWEARRQARDAGSDWNAAKRAANEAVSGLLLPDGDLMNDLRRALARPRFVRPWRSTGMLFDELLPLVSPARSVGLVLAEHMRRASDRGEWEDAIEAMRLGMRLGEVTARQPSAIHYIVGAAIQTAILQEARHILTERDVPPASAAEFGVVGAGFELPPVEYAIEVGRLDMQSILQSTHGSGGYALPLRTLFDAVGTSGGLTAMSPIDPINDERSLLRAAISRWYFATRAENGVLADRWYEALKARAKEPFASRWYGWPSPSILEAIGDRRHAVLAYFTPSLERLVDQPDLLAVERAATRAMTAIEQYQADHGHPPADLQELLPDYVADAPRDPLHGSLFGYRLLEDDRHARAYLLYSFGADGVDDGGRFDQDDSRLGFSRAGAGYDAPLNLPREDGRE
jgi:hypothetical protein